MSSPCHCLAAAATMLLAVPALADDFDNRAYVAPMGSYALADDARATGNAIGATLGLGKRVTEHVEVELLGSYLRYRADAVAQPGSCTMLGIGCIAQPDDTRVKGFGGGVNLFPFGAGLFVHAGAMGGSGALLDAGVGYDLPLGGIVDGLTARAEALYHHDGDFDEPLFNLGLRIPLGARAKPIALAAAPVQVVPPVVAPPPPAPPPPACTLPADGAAPQLDGCKPGDTLVLKGVNFDFDRATLTANARTILDGVAEALVRRPDLEVEVDGHTDSVGSDAYNQTLSAKRARAVMAYLSSHGVDAGRLTARGYGESQPVADNDTDEGRELNRRVELKVLDGASPPASPEPVAAPPAAPMPAAATPAPAPTMEPAPAPAAAAAATAYAEAQVAISGFSFQPEMLTVAPGTTVIWTNLDKVGHSISFDGGETTDRIAPGGVYSKRFDAPGSYAYHCGVHPAMAGRIVVGATP